MSDPMDRPFLENVHASYSPDTSLHTVHLQFTEERWSILVFKIGESPSEIIKRLRRLADELQRAYPETP